MDVLKNKLLQAVAADPGQSVVLLTDAKCQKVQESIKHVLERIEEVCEKTDHVAERLYHGCR